MTRQSNLCNLLCRTYLILFALGVISCSSEPYFKEESLRASYKNAPACILNRPRISKSSRHAIRDMEQRNSQTPTNINERIAVAELAIAETKKRSNQSPEQAIPHYLKTTETLWPIVKNSTSAITLNNKHQDQQKKLQLAKSLYKHAAGQIARIVTQHFAIKATQQSIKLSKQTLSINTRSPYSIHPSFFDEIRPLDNYTYGNVGKYHHKTKGLGAPLIGYQTRSTERLKSNPLIPPNGIDMPINAIIDYPRPHQPRLTLTNLLKTDTTLITGKRRVLAADYSAAVAAIASTQSNNLGLSISIRPNDHKNRMGLFALGPYDPEKIPVIMTHGLVSQPSTWTTVTNHLVSDPILRKNYQLFYYFYPTSYPAMISGAKFRKALLAFYQSHAHENNPNLNRTVLIGHSMGGLLSSIQSRTFGQGLWDQLFKETPTNQDESSAYAQVKVLFENPTLHQIERTIFIATPHRGSQLADNWIGKIGSSLIQLPQSLMSLEIQTTSESMTTLGRSLVNQGPANSVTQLKAKNPVLMLLVKQPFNKRVTYHSIIGDRGKGTGNKSSDGVVPYWSSHLDGAASEKIVPANHEAHLNPQAHEEISRILHLHLKSRR
jgi:triacylglycerol esterase/lipase EstA (alpha/beta hydrolase family)